MAFRRIVIVILFIAIFVLVGISTWNDKSSEPIPLTTRVAMAMAGRQCAADCARTKQAGLVPRLILRPALPTTTTTVAPPPPPTPTTTVQQRPLISSTQNFQNPSAALATPPPSGTDAWAALPANVQAAFECIEGPNAHGSGESGGNPTAVNPTSGAGGLFQFMPETWIGNGGGRFASVAQNASAWQQEQVAAWTYGRDGFNPWQGDNWCWEQFGLAT